jgi:hypothetical protein
LAVIWLVVSIVVMGALSLVVYLKGTRRNARSADYLEFDDSDVVSFASERRPRSLAAGGGGGDRDLFVGERSAEPAVNHRVTAESGALDRLLAGVQMPCGLERLRPDGEDERLRMAFATSGQEPKVVAVSVVDELERLGMDVEPLSFTEARAWRDGFELAITIHLDPRHVIRNRRPAFPNAKPEAVVIEFSVV